MAQTSLVFKSNVTASQTDSSLISAVGEKLIRVVSLFMVSGATATNVTFNSKGSGSGTAITALIADGANGGIVLPYNPDGWFETVAGEGLSVTTSSGSSTGITGKYVTI